MINIGRPQSSLPNDILPVSMRPPPTKPPKNIIQVFLRKRLSTSGMLWIDRIPADMINEYDEEYDTVKGSEYQNYVMESSSSNTEEKISQMKLLRYKGVNDWLCFDEEDDSNDNAIKAINIASGFKNFVKGRKTLKTDSSALFNS